MVQAEVDGANAILADSLAVYKVGAQRIVELAGNKQIVLPVPAFNGTNGGSHADNKLAMQEFMILRIGASSFKEAIKIGSEVHHHLKVVLTFEFMSFTFMNFPLLIIMCYLLCSLSKCSISCG
ncbi:hypothetical protein RND81_08G184900 [Saponaria officinalis]|uniref:phosphopyruvate hydratase n=1 Tax=Saponaria officinalis TaxID=3572 RepID=A0AAW1J9N9_SAPOF